MKSWKLYGELFAVFFKIGAFTFGGGYAMLPVIEDECIDRRNWIGAEEFMDVVAIAESTPGPVAVNSATYIGNKQGGLAGAAAATLGVVMPSFIIIYIISTFLDKFLELRVVANAFSGIKVAVALLIIDAAVRMIKNATKAKKKRGISIVIICAAAMAMLAIDIFSLSFSGFYMVLISIVVGYIYYLCTRNKGCQE